MTYHVLNGDALIKTFLDTELEGEMIIARECLIDGDLSGNNEAEFYQTRAQYIEATYGEKQINYYCRVVTEFEKFKSAPNNSEFNLWFGYDLFCQVNIWFIISILHDLPINKSISVVYPSYLKGEDIWKDFGSATPEKLKNCFDNKVQFRSVDLLLAKELWEAYKVNDQNLLERLSRQNSPCFPYLQEVCKAHIERFPLNGEKGRPELVLENLLKINRNDFYIIFNEFSKTEGIYGFGDSQVKLLYNKILKNGFKFLKN